MATVCTSGGGRLIRATNVQSAAPLIVLLNGSPIPFNLGVVSGVQATAQVAAQFMNAFNGNIYVTPFGDTPGNAAIQFILNRQENCSGQIGTIGTAPVSSASSGG